MKNKIFKEIFEKSPIGILFYDLNGKLVDANASALKIIGKSKLDDILGTNIFHNIYLEQNRDKLIEEGSLKFQSKPLQNISEKSLFNLNDSSRFIDWNVSIRFDSACIYWSNRRVYRSNFNKGNKTPDGH